MRGVRLSTLAAVALGVLPSPALANFSCKATPAAYLAVNSDGVVYTAVEGVGILGICSVGNQLASVHPDACRGWYSALLTARVGGKTAWLYFNPDEPANQGATGCSAFTNWNIRVPYHFEMQSSG